MNTNNFIKVAKYLINKNYYKLPAYILPVWFNYTLGNMKGLFIAQSPDSRYFEVTYNKATGEVYLDEYTKVSHKVIVKDDYEKLV